MSRHEQQYLVPVSSDVSQAAQPVNARSGV
jgi:hypothetical protein